LSAKKQAEELLMVPGGCAEGKEEPQKSGWHFFGVLQSQPFASESNKKVVQFSRWKLWPTIPSCHAVPCAVGSTILVLVTQHQQVHVLPRAKHQHHHHYWHYPGHLCHQYDLQSHLCHVHHLQHLHCQQRFMWRSTHLMETYLEARWDEIDRCWLGGRCNFHQTHQQQTFGGSMGKMEDDFILYTFFFFVMAPFQKPCLFPQGGNGVTVVWLKNQMALLVRNEGYPTSTG